jgi:hypothetical protein
MATTTKDTDITWQIILTCTKDIPVDAMKALGGVELIISLDRV